MKCPHCAGDGFIETTWHDGGDFRCNISECAYCYGSGLNLDATGFQIGV